MNFRSRVVLFGLPIMLACVFSAGWIAAQDDTSGRKMPLDLPSGGIGSEDDEDAPESITFYGAEFEAEAFFWCLDRSGSMEGAPIQTLKAEMVDAVNQLSRRTEFGIMSFASDFDIWQSVPVKASTRWKGEAINYINDMIAQGWTCMQSAVGEICAIANKSKIRNKAIILVGDGMPWCGCIDSSGCLKTTETIDALTSNNYKRIKVNTVFISRDEDGINFFRNIAAMFGGKFTNVD